MDEEILSRLAIDEADPAELELDPPDRLLFFELREIYRLYRMKKFPKEICAVKKRQAIQRRDTLRRELADAVKVRIEQAEFWRRVEYAATAYAKSEERTTAGDDLYESVYRLRPSRKHDNDIPFEKGKQNERKRDDYAAPRDCIAKQSEESPG